VDWSSQWVLLIISLIANAFSAFVGGGAGLLLVACADISRSDLQCGTGDT